MRRIGVRAIIANSVFLSRKWLLGDSLQVGQRDSYGFPPAGISTHPRCTASTAASVRERTPSLP